MFNFYECINMSLSPRPLEVWCEILDMNLEQVVYKVGRGHLIPREDYDRVFNNPDVREWLQEKLLRDAKMSYKQTTPPDQGEVGIKSYDAVASGRTIIEARP